MVGLLIYGIVEIKPDIGYTVGVVSRFTSNLNASHLEATKHILRYLKGTLDDAIQFGGNNQDLYSYTNADWGGDKESRKSTRAYLFCLYRGAISWSSKLQ